MQNKIPLFQFHAAQASNKYVAFIELDGKIIHEIKNPGEFYREFGFAPDVGMTGVLPEEFIWDEYVKDSTLKSTVCRQAHIIGYLKKHSDKFITNYGNQYERWLAAYAEVVAASDIACFACRMKLSCGIRKK